MSLSDEHYLELCPQTYMRPSLQTVEALHHWTTTETQQLTSSMQTDLGWSPDTCLLLSVPSMCRCLVSHSPSVTSGVPGLDKHAYDYFSLTGHCSGQTRGATVRRQQTHPDRTRLSPGSREEGLLTAGSLANCCCYCWCWCRLAVQPLLLTSASLPSSLSSLFPNLSRARMDAFSRAVFVVRAKVTEGRCESLENWRCLQASDGECFYIGDCRNFQRARESRGRQSRPRDVRSWRQKNGHMEDIIQRQKLSVVLVWAH
ncbi:hypothetical protein WMY93_007387 [Mugilogobius chulae]|uniref:Uncharacterized protein n=1 Tax=Mugilogobius chulae TaxID=88201 RepID=A0AAW0PI07_9GOBI